MTENTSPSKNETSGDSESGGTPAELAKRGKPPLASLRAFWVVVHRYTGLTIATFLIVAALTGSALAFYQELDRFINPEYLRVDAPSEDAQPLDPLALRERAMEQVPGWEINTLVLSHDPGYSTAFWQRVETGGWRAVFVDPYSGTVLGSRSGADITQGIEYLMPFLYRLHYELALGKTGELLFGIVALLWTIDCFVGFYLTLPPKTKQKNAGKRSRSWLSRWRPSWLVKGGSLFKSMFTFHRASGLWVWPLLFVFAWSAVGFNLGEVYYPVMRVLGTDEETVWEFPERDEPLVDPVLGWEEALEQARGLMAEEAVSREFTIKEEGLMSYDSSHGVYEYRVHSSLDVGKKYPGARLWFDANSGKLLSFWVPTGMATGDTITSWLIALHMGTVGGLPYRILVSVVGVLIAGLSISGVFIWWKKLRARRRNSRV